MRLTQPNDPMAAAEMVPSEQIPVTPAAPQVAPVSAYQEARNEKTFDDHKYEKLFSWQTVEDLGAMLPESGILAEKGITRERPEITSSLPVTPDMIKKAVKDWNIPTEYVGDLAGSKNIVELHSKLSLIRENLQAQQRLGQVYGSEVVQTGGAFMSPMWLIANAASGGLASAAKVGGAAKSLAAAGALKGGAKIAKGAGFAAETGINAAANVAIGEIDRNIRGIEDSSHAMVLDGIIGGIAPHAFNTGGWMLNKTTKAINETAGKAFKGKGLETTDHFGNLTHEETVSHGDGTETPAAAPMEPVVVKPAEPTVNADGQLELPLQGGTPVKPAEAPDFMQTIRDNTRKELEAYVADRKAQGKDTEPHQGELDFLNDTPALKSELKDTDLETARKSLLDAFQKLKNQKATTLGDDVKALHKEAAFEAHHGVPDGAIEPGWSLTKNPEQHLEQAVIAKAEQHVKAAETLPVEQQAAVEPQVKALKEAIAKKKPAEKAPAAPRVASKDVPQGVDVPAELLAAKPSYSVEGVKFTPEFASVIDQALFHVGRTAKSKFDEKYMEMLRKVFPKLNDAEIRSRGQQLTEFHVRGNAMTLKETKGLSQGDTAKLPLKNIWQDHVNPIGKAHEPVVHTTEPIVPKEGLQQADIEALAEQPLEVQQKVIQKVLDQKVEAHDANTTGPAPGEEVIRHKKTGETLIWKSKAIELVKEAHAKLMANPEAGISERNGRFYSFGVQVEKPNGGGPLYMDTTGLNINKGYASKEALIKKLKAMELPSDAAIWEGVANHTIKGIDAHYVHGTAPVGKQAADVTKANTTGVMLDGKPIKAANVDSPEFREWFDGSQITGKDGKPLVVYHGTDGDFASFKPTAAKRGGANGELVRGPDAPAYFFSPSRETAGFYAENRGDAMGGGANVIPVYLSIKKPLDFRPLLDKPSGRWGLVAELNALGFKNLDEYRYELQKNATSWSEAGWKIFDNKDFIQQAKSLGYDGAIIHGTGHGLDPEYVAFEPTQVKSAIGNTGEYSKTNPNMQGFITPGVALGLVGVSGLALYAQNANASDGTVGADLLGKLPAALGGLMVLGMTKGNKSIMQALEHPTKLSEVVTHPEVKTNPEAVTVQTPVGDFKLLDVKAKGQERPTDGTAGYSAVIPKSIPFVGGKEVKDFTAHIGDEIRNSPMPTQRVLGSFLSSSIAGNKGRGTMNHSTGDVHKELLVKRGITEMGMAFNENLGAYAKAKGMNTPDMILAHNMDFIRQFNDEVVRAKKGFTDVSPEAIKVANAMTKSKGSLIEMARQVREEMKAKGTLVEGSLIDHAGQLINDEKYFGAQVNLDTFYALRNKVGGEKVQQLISRSFQKENPGIGEEKAYVIAGKYMEVLMGLEHGKVNAVSMQNLDAFKKYLKETGKYSEEDIAQLADVIIPSSKAESKPGIFKKRTNLDRDYAMDTTDLEGNPTTISMRELYNQDARKEHASWVESMAGIIGVAKTSLDFGHDLTHGPTFKHFLDVAREEARGTKLTLDQVNRQLKVTEDLHGKLIGHNAENSVFKSSHAAVQLLNDTTTLLSQAGFAFAATPELARAVQTRGLANVLRESPELAQVVKAAMGGEIDHGLARQIVSGFGMGDHQSATLVDALTEGAVSSANSHVKLAVGQAAQLNGFTGITHATKYIAIKGGIQELSDLARGAVQQGDLNWNQKALRGMDPALFHEVKDLLVKHTVVDEQGLVKEFDIDGLFKEDTTKGMDLMSHLYRLGQAAGSEPAGIGETHIFQHNDAGRVALKFMGTPLHMWHRMKGDMTNFDSEVAASWVTSMSTAALAYVMLTYLNHHGDQNTLEKKLTPQEIAKAAFRNGPWGLAPGTIDLASSMMGFGPQFSGQTNSGRAGSVDLPINALGTRITSTAQTLNHLVRGQDISKNEATRAMKTPLWALNAMLPFATQNLPDHVERPKQ